MLPTLLAVHFFCLLYDPHFVHPKKQKRTRPVVNKVNSYVGWQYGRQTNDSAYVREEFEQL